MIDRFDYPVVRSGDLEVKYGMERLVKIIPGVSPMKKVLLRFLLANSQHAYDILTTEDDARCKIEEWRNNRVNYVHGYDSEQGRYYAVKSAEIAAMFTMDWEQMKRLQQEQLKQQQAGLPGKPPV